MYQKMKFLSSQQIENLSKWKYSCVDNSITTKLLTDFWNNCLEYISIYIHPNLITLTGLICVKSASIIANEISICIADNCGNIHYYIAAICILLFLSLTFDALDGKQARRINMSSPVGELLDHVVDSCSLMLVIYISCIIFRIDPEIQNFYYIGCGLFFTTTHFDALINKVVVFDRYSGPNEFYFLIFVLYMISPFTYISDIANSRLFMISFLIIPIMKMYYILIKGNINKKNRNIIATAFFSAMIVTFSLLFLSINNVITFRHYLACFSILNTEMIISKMSNYPMNPWSIILSIIVLFVSERIAFNMFIIYIFFIFKQISSTLHISMFTVI